MRNFVQSRILPLVLGSTAVVLASTAPAHALDFNFSFTNGTTGTGSNGGNVNGTVTGIIKGLTNNATGAATEVDLTSYPSGLGTNNLGNTVYSSTGSSWSAQILNSFTVSNGIITAYNFISESYPEVFCISSTSVCQPDYSPQAELTFYGYADLVGSYGGSGVTFTSASAAPVPFDIPYGATIPAIGSILALGVMRKARKSTSNTFSITTTEKVN